MRVFCQANEYGFLKVSSFRMPDGTTREIHPTVGGIQAERSEGLDVGKEGEINATTSSFARLLAPVSLVGPSRVAADTTLQKTAWSLSVEGRKGFALLGASSPGIGRHGNWVRILWRRKETLRCIHYEGSNVELPVNTPIFLRLDPNDPSVALATR
jgi:hypothetical protein